MPSPPPPGSPACGPLRPGPDGARFVRAALSAREQARLAHALGDEVAASVLYEQALARARAAARHREQFRAWKIVVD